MTLQGIPAYERGRLPRSQIAQGFGFAPAARTGRPMGAVTRRRFLAGLGAALVVSQAGCGGNQGSARLASERAGQPSEAVRERIWYVDIEHERVLANDPRSLDHFATRNHRAVLLGEIAGVDCEPIHYLEVSQTLASERNVRAIVLSGNVTDWEEYDFATFQSLSELIKRTSIPVLGVCGGCQLIAFLYGGRCGPMRRLEPGEEDPGRFAPGWFKELDYQPVRVVEQDPLFDGLGPEPVFFESHYWQITRLPRRFRLLASTDACRVQVMRHRTRLIYGTQFHPEVHTDENPDGRTLLANFFRLAGIG